MLLGITAVVAAVVAAAATSVVLLLGKGESPTAMALQSGQAIGRATGLTLTGTINGTAANVSVTRAGTVEGSYTQDHSQVSRITVGGVTYLKAPAAFWSQEGDQSSAQQAAGNWARAPAGTVLMSFGALTPGQISGILEHVGQQPKAVSTTFNGTKVIKLTAHGTTYYITANTPNQLVHMDGVSGAARYSFDVAPLTAATIGPVFTVLHSDVHALQGAAAPGAAVMPLEKVQFNSDCNGNTSCTVHIKVSVTDANVPRVLVKMTADFSATENGGPFATCTDFLSVNTTTVATVTPSCGLHGSVWSKWVNSHTTNFSTWADAQFKVTVNSASDIAAVQDELNKEQGT